MTVLSVVPANRLNMNEIRSEIGSPATNLFDFKWSDHILNDIQWLRGDTFSWQSGLVYTTAYGHLVDDVDAISGMYSVTVSNTVYVRDTSNDADYGYQYAFNSGVGLCYFDTETPAVGATAYETPDVGVPNELGTVSVAGIQKQTHTETIGSYTITYYLTEDGHKIVLADMEETVANIYNESGVAWYYILDTDNQRFKLPRTKYGFTGLRDDVGNYVAESLPNITGSFTSTQWDTVTTSGAFSQGSITSSRDSADITGNIRRTILFNAVDSSSTYRDGAPVQQRATQMYLYFYVGNYTQSAIEQTAGITTEALNNKVDVDVANLSDTGKSLIAGLQAPSDEYEEVTLLASGQEYTAPSDGYFAFFSSAVSNSTIANKSGYFGSTVIGASGYPNRNVCPVKAGDKIVLSYSSSGTLRFYYTVGNESEVI